MRDHADDLAHMRAALALAQRNLGRTWPNPSVGCVVVKDGRVVARGWTARGGRPHAEALALERAGAAARGADVFVTLEPCAHHGRTPPCADALITAGVRRVVAALEDPDPRVSGRGLARLRAAGVAMELGPGALEAGEIVAGFVLRVREGRPLVTLKLATSLDGRIATHRGESRWISSPASRAVVHAMRASHDAIMIGIGTALADDPELTCRLAGHEASQPVRIVVDRRLRLPLTSRLVVGAQAIPTWIVAGDDAARDRRDAFMAAGCHVLTAPGDESGLVLGEVMRRLGAQGLTRVLVEGGAHLAAGLMRANLVDRIAIFRAGMMLGGDGIPAAVGFGVERLDAAPRFHLRRVAACGPDSAELWARA